MLKNSVRKLQLDTFAEVELQAQREINLIDREAPHHITPERTLAVCRRRRKRRGVETPSPSHSRIANVEGHAGYQIRTGETKEIAEAKPSD